MKLLDNILITNGIKTGITIHTRLVYRHEDYNKSDRITYEILITKSTADERGGTDDKDTKVNLEYNDQFSIGTMIAEHIGDPLKGEFMPETNKGYLANYSVNYSGKDDKIPR
jgi:hypothetical protein